MSGGSSRHGSTARLPQFAPGRTGPERITTATTIEMSREFHGHFGEREALS